MFTSKSLKMGFVALFSCLALMLGMFASTGIASAHSANAAQSKTSTSQTSLNWRRRHHHHDFVCVKVTFVKVVFVPVHQNWWDSQTLNDWNSWGQWDTQQNLSWSQNSAFFDTNPWDFNNFNMNEENHFQGFFIVIVTEKIFCGGQFERETSFSFDR